MRTSAGFAAVCGLQRCRPAALVLTFALLFGLSLGSFGWISRPLEWTLTHSEWTLVHSDLGSVHSRAYLVAGLGAVADGGATSWTGVRIHTGGREGAQA